MDKQELITAQNIRNRSTESRNKDTMNLDISSTRKILEMINHEDQKVPKAVETLLPKIEEIVENAVYALKNNGRIVYIGAGTSGRLGVLDAVECPPTFGVDDKTVVGLMAGGEKAFVKAQEGAEDSEELCIRDLKEINLSSNDILIGLAASGRTPYVIGGLKYAKEVGCKSVAISCNLGSEISKYSDISLEIEVGPEVLTGSTRMKAGTAQKLVLNMISTTAMIKMGKVYENLMVDLKITNEKLHKRAISNIMEITSCSEEIASATLEEAKRDVKLAIVMVLLGCDKETAKEKLISSKGFIRNI